MQQRKIIHIDMDAFFTSVEQRDNPSLRGKPVIVGGRPGTRGVVAGCSYEARKFGIHSAMPSTQAHRLCPQAIFVSGRFEAYTEASEQIREIFAQYTELIEPLSLDEAYLDVTENVRKITSATQIAKEIREKIFRKTQLTASAGVSYNKFLAKMASDFNKPDGLTVIRPEQAAEFIKKLPIGKFYGVGKVTEKKMLSLGIKNGTDLLQWPLDKLVVLFGKSGEFYYQIVRGIDNRPVEPVWERASYGKEKTFQQDLTEMSQITEFLENMAVRVSEGLNRHNLSGRTVTLKIRYSDFTTLTRCISGNDLINTSHDIMNHVLELLKKTEAGTRPVRLLGITVSGFEQKLQFCQMEMEFPSEIDFKKLRG